MCVRASSRQASNNTQGKNQHVHRPHPLSLTHSFTQAHPLDFIVCGKGILAGGHGVQADVGAEGRRNPPAKKKNERVRAASTL